MTSTIFAIIAVTVYAIISTYYERRRCNLISDMIARILDMDETLGELSLGFCETSCTRKCSQRRTLDKYQDEQLIKIAIQHFKNNPQSPEQVDEIREAFLGKCGEGCGCHEGAGI